MSLVYRPVNGVDHLQHAEVRITEYLYINLVTCTTITEQCSPLNNPINGTCLPDGCQGYTNDTVHFSCQDGYKLHGLSSLTCLSNATWSGTVPECKRKLFSYLFTNDFSNVYPGKCQEISVDGIRCNASSTCSASSGDTLLLSCIPGYVLKGTSLLLICGADGQWSSEIPSCVKSCPTHPTPANGSCDPVDCSGAIGDQITFTCDDGYKLHGSAKLSCLNEGIWSDYKDNDLIPTCKGE